MSLPRPTGLLPCGELTADDFEALPLTAQVQWCTLHEPADMTTEQIRGFLALNAPSTRARRGRSRGLMR